MSLLGDHSPGLSPRRHGDEFQKMVDKQVTETGRKTPNHVRFLENNGNSCPQTLPTKHSPSARYNGAQPSVSQPQRHSSKDGCFPPKGFSNPANYHNSVSQRLTTFGTSGRLSVTSADDDGTTTTSGSYIINPEEIRMDSYVGSDIIV